MKNIHVLIFILYGTTLPTHTKKNLDYFRYFCANYYQFSGNISNSLFWYQKLLHPDTSVHAYKGYIHLLNITGNHLKIAQLVPKLDESMEHDPTIQLIFANALGRIGKIEEHDSRIISLSHNNQLDPHIALEAAQVYLRKKEPENAIATIDGYLNKAARKPQNFIFYFCKAQVYFELHEYPKALEAITQCTKLHPGFPKGWLLLAMLQEKMGNKEESNASYQTFLSFSSEVPDAIKKQIEQKTTPDNKPPQQTDAHDRILQKAIQLTAQKEYSQALTIVEKLLRTNPDHIQVRLLKIHLLTQLNLVDSLIDTLTLWIDSEPNNHFWLDTLHRLSRTNIPTTKAIMALENLEKKHPRSLLMSLYLADLYLKEHEYRKAYPRLELSLSITQNPKLKVSIVYQMSIIHHEEQEYDKMVSLLEQGQQLNVPYAPLLNLLAYSYAKMGTKLDEAEALITQALTIDHNPHFLDTHALVLQAQNKSKEALDMLEQAAKAAPQDPTILRHLGTAHDNNGNHAAARRSYERALAAASTDKDRKKVERHLHTAPKDPIVRTAGQNEAVQGTSNKL